MCCMCLVKYFVFYICSESIATMKNVNLLMLDVSVFVVVIHVFDVPVIGYGQFL